jgi:ribose 5-phosphate isomerase B
MRIALAADHAGAQLKAELLERLPAELPGHSWLDLGGDGSDLHDDYPDYARALGEAIRSGTADRGILVCGSGVGASVAASKMRGIRAAVCHDSYSARQGVEHDDLNVLCLGARVIGPELALVCARAFLGAEFSGGERHRRRLGKVAAIEQEETTGASDTGSPP